LLPDPSDPLPSSSGRDMERVDHDVFSEGRPQQRFVSAVAPSDVLLQNFDEGVFLRICHDPVSTSGLHTPYRVLSVASPPNVAVQWLKGLARNLPMQIA